MCLNMLYKFFCVNNLRYRERCFSSCHKRGTKKKILSPHEESNLRPLDSAQRCSITEPQRLYGERGLLRSSFETRSA